MLGYLNLAKLQNSAYNKKVMQFKAFAAKITKLRV